MKTSFVLLHLLMAAFVQVFGRRQSQNLRRTQAAGG
jgi:hypothetical protein